MGEGRGWEGERASYCSLPFALINSCKYTLTIPALPDVLL